MVTFLGDEFQHTAISKPVSILDTEAHGSLVSGNGVTVELVQSRCWQQNLVTLFNILSESKRCWVNAKS